MIQFIKNIIFAKISAPNDIIFHYAESYGIDLAFQADVYNIEDEKVWPRFMATDICPPIENSDVCKRSE